MKQVQELEPEPRSQAVLMESTPIHTQELEHEIVRLVYEQSPTGLVGSLLVALILGFVLANVMPPTEVWIWLTYMVLVTLMRFLMYHSYLKDARARERVSLWRTWHILGAAFAGFGWGYVSLVLFPHDSIPHQAFLAFMIGGVVAGAVPVLTPMMTSLLVFVLLSLVPLILSFFLYGVHVQWAMGLAALVFLLTMVASAWRIRSTILNALSLRLENTSLVTFLTQAKERSEQLNEGLKAEIGERLRMEQDLQKAKEEAEQASSAKGEFLATVSHEIRTPMNGVLGTLELLEDMEMGEEQRELVVTAHSSAETLIKIINNVLDFSKIESGQMQLENIEFDLVKTVADVTNLVGRRARTKGVQVSYSLATDLPVVMRGDPTRLRQVLSNLVNNAEKFTQKGRIQVRGSLVRQSRTDYLLRFEVEDSGIGIPVDVQQRLFRPFTQADGSMARRFGGSGLGLSIAKRLVELMGGQIGVTSTPGQGSTFWFTVRLSKRHDTKHSARSDLLGSRILLVVHTPVLRHTLEQELSHWRASQNQAIFLLEAIDKLREGARIGITWCYDVVIIQGGRPGLDPADFARRVKAEMLPIEPAVILVGDPELASVADETAEIDGFISMPVQLDTLFDLLCQLARETRKPGEGEGAHEEEGLVLPTEKPWSSKSVTSQGQPAAAVAEETLSLDSVLPPSQASVPKPLPDAIPIRQTAIQSQPPTPSAVNATEPASPPTGALVLLVEDNLVNQKVARQMLLKSGYQVDVAENGFQALEAVDKRGFDVILMDCQMPGMDGFEATRLIRQREEGGHKGRLPILALTANAMQGDRERCLESGMDDYLSKPVKQAQLKEMIDRWLEITGSRRGREEQNKSATPAPTFSGHKILLVEDNQVNQKVAMANLRKLGIQADMVDNGRQAVIASREGGYDLILMDCQLPEMDGYEATRAIRQQERQSASERRIPIIAMTASTHPGDRDLSQQVGMDDFLDKPFTRPDLAAMLAKWLPATDSSPKEPQPMPQPSHSSGGESPALDPIVLGELRELLEDGFNELLQSYLSESPKRLMEIRDAILSKKADTMGLAAHSLKSGSANLGALTLSAMAKELEILGRSGTVEGAVEPFKRLVAEYQRVKREIDALLI